MKYDTEKDNFWLAPLEIRLQFIIMAGYQCPYITNRRIFVLF